MGGQQEAKKRPLPWSDESVYEGCDCPRGCCWCGLLVGQGGGGDVVSRWKHGKGETRILGKEGYEGLPE
jgi:hypothetical protein